MTLIAQNVHKFYLRHFGTEQAVFLPSLFLFSSEFSNCRRKICESERFNADTQKAKEPNEISQDEKFWG